MLFNSPNLGIILSIVSFTANFWTYAITDFLSHYRKHTCADNFAHCVANIIAYTTGKLSCFACLPLFF